ncbi:hypothetical protein AUF78_01815 [archaeon 13_1_20CM_2_51_12]|nr:MAG: hypothetical protein AUF78_01815 [archaeon 13_1_20CM_2_51_12]
MRTALIPVFTALSLATNYAMIDIPNVKLMDAFVFIAAFLFGLEVGLGTAISIWAVYGFINPYGQDDLTLLLFLMTGECLYAIAGTLLSRTSIARDLIAKQIQAKTIDKQSIKYSMHSETGSLSRITNRAGNLLEKAGQYGKMSLLFGLIGFQATFAYDVLTNFGSWVFKTSSLYQALIIGMITGVPFAILHEASNLVFFATVVPPAIAAAKRVGLHIQQRIT